MKYQRAVVSWLIVLWMCYVFLGSLPYKFSKHPDTQHIFGTIGDWLGTFLGPAFGNLFSELGAYVIGSFELLTSIVLLLPAVLWLLARQRGTHFGATRRRFHMYGGLMASAVMAGAVFFHLVSPLGVEVLHEGQSDGGSLFYAALSILILGLVLFMINRGWTDEESHART
ncbi:hypothetical protein ACUNV4_01595 [Granulosicoccus sp. 3-233]|uniref:hypothetical protein n=1 Tax=Granulosicoccus sp. 3-233 TaxID=3417969 RepID=UPI003D345205